MTLHAKLRQKWWVVYLPNSPYKFLFWISNARL
jgi:hypothetical protein